MFAAILYLFWPLKKVILSFLSCLLGFSIRFYCSKICKGFMLGLNRSLFLLNSSKQKLVFPKLLVFLYTIIDNSEIDFKYRAKIVEHANFERVLNINILLFNTSLKSIILSLILRFIFASSICKLINRNDSCSFICSILKSILYLQLFSKIIS